MASSADNVDWQLSQKRINERSGHLLKSEQWSDCAFIVGTEPNQKVYNAHKLFLAMSSPVFEAMFFGGMAEKNEPIPILDVQPDAFRALLEYIYTDKMNIRTFDQACELCYAAKKYMLPHLVEKCTERLWQDLFGSNACKAYEFAKLFEEPVLMDRSLQIIRNDTETVLSDTSFEDIELATLLLILDSQTLNISSERDLFNGVYRWAIKECGRKGLAEDSENLRSVIGPALEKIHFLTLTPRQFAEGPAPGPLLSRDESFAILMNISNPSGSCVPMPNGFSTVVEPRKRFRIISEQQQQQPMTVVTANAREGTRYVCTRGKDLPITPAINNSIMDCNLSFAVDRNICVLGIQIPSQIRVEEGAQRFPVAQNQSYTELLYAHLLDSDNSRLTYTHYTTRVWYGSQVEINFNRAVFIQRNKTYKIVVVLNKQGWYPTYSEAAAMVHCNGVNFTFTDHSTPELMGRQSLIRSIIYGF